MESHGKALSSEEPTLFIHKFSNYSLIMSHEPCIIQGARGKPGNKTVHAYILVGDRQSEVVTSGMKTTTVCSLVPGGCLDNASYSGTVAEERARVMGNYLDTFFSVEIKCQVVCLLS